jgi:type I restriction enzyme S subunit
MRKYSEYKSSKCSLYGDIPNHWEIKKMSYVCDTITDFVASGSFADLRENVTYLDDPNFAMLVRTVDLSKKNSSSAKVYISKQSYQFLSNSNLFGGELILPNIGSVGDAYIVPIGLYEHMSLAPNSIMVKSECNRYLYYFFCSKCGHDALINIAQGSTQAKFNKTELRALKIIVPPIEEQISISKYLDQKCDSIDKVIAAQEKRVEYLTELKNRIITDAVTKGINQDVAMKNSGIEWIGNIPSHWNVMPFKRCMRIYNGADYKHIESDIDNGYPVLGSGGVFAYALEYMYDGEALLLGRKGTIDRPLYINGKFWTVDTMYYSVPLKNAYCKYVYYQALNFPFKRYYTATALPSMTARDLNENPICLPPYQEQVQIVAYIEAKIAPIESAIAKAKREIELLKEFKQSIITDAVTGKIKVYDL